MDVYVLQYYSEVIGVFKGANLAAEFIAKRLGIDDFRLGSMEKHDSHGVYWIWGQYTIQQTPFR